MRPAIAVSRSLRVIVSKTCSASLTGSETYSPIERPFSFTDRLSARSRAPWHSAHSRSAR